MPEEKKKYYGMTLKMPSLKSSDYFLFKEAKTFFHLDMRGVFTLLLRFLYLCLHRKELRIELLKIASEISKEDLNMEEGVVVYTSFDRIKEE